VLNNNDRDKIPVSQAMPNLKGPIKHSIKKAIVILISPYIVFQINIKARDRPEEVILSKLF
jgi:hypothetical protein